MRLLRTNTATRVSVGPFFDVTDGITPEVALTVTGCHVTLIVDAAGVPTLAVDVDATGSAGDNDMVHITGDDAGFYDLELTAAQTNYLGRAKLCIIDTDVHLPVFEEFMIVTANAYDTLCSTDIWNVNLTTIADTSQTARDLGTSVLISSGTGTGQLAVTSGVINANVTAMAADTVTATAIADAAIDNATFATDTSIRNAHSGATQAGSGASTIVLASGASSVNEFYKGQTVLVTAGTAIGQARIIASYVGSTRTATITVAWATTPATGDTYVVAPFSDALADIQAATQAAMQVYNLDHLLAVACPTPTEFSSAVEQYSALGHMASKSSANTFVRTTDALEALRDDMATAADLAAFQKNTAVTGFQFFMVDTAGVAATGKTVTATRSIDGAAFAACANSVSEISGGWYKIDLATTDLNGEIIALNFAASGCRTCAMIIKTQA